MRSTRNQKLVCAKSNGHSNKQTTKHDMSTIFLLFAHLRKGDHTHLAKKLCLLHVFVIYDLENVQRFWGSLFLLPFACLEFFQFYFTYFLQLFLSFGSNILDSLIVLFGLGFFVLLGIQLFLDIFNRFFFRYLFANSSSFILIFLLTVLTFNCVAHFVGCVLGQVYFPFIFTCCC